MIAAIDVASLGLLAGGAQIAGLGLLDRAVADYDAAPLQPGACVPLDHGTTPIISDSRRKKKRSAIALLFLSG